MALAIPLFPKSKTQLVTQFKPSPNLPVDTLLRQQVLPNGKHLGANPRREPIDLLRVEIHLPRVQQALEPARLLRQLEQLAPLVLGQRRLLGGDARRVLGLALRLPLGDLGLLAAQLALVELEVVEVRVVLLDGLEEEVGRLLERGVDGEVEGLEGGVEGRVDGGGGQVVEGERGVRGGAGRGRGELVEVRG